MAEKGENTQKEVRMLPAREAILGGLALGIITATLTSGLLILGKVSADSAVAAGTLALACTTVLSILRSEKLSADQLYQARWIKEQETKPYCAIVYVKNTSTSTSEGVYVKNLGAGPALKTAWTFKYEGKTYVGKHGLEELIGRCGLTGQLELFLPDMIAPSASESIFRLISKKKLFLWITDPKWKVARQRLHELMEKLIIQISYESITWKGHREDRQFTPDDAW